jgi:hypothetical protein
LPVEPGIPGSATFNKPSEEEARDFDHAKDESIYRTDNADDLLTKRERIDTREDNADKHDGIGYMVSAPGKWDEDHPSKTKYPYRDNVPNQHNAAQVVADRWERKTSAEFVAELWAAEHAHVLRLASEATIKVALRLDGIVDGLNPKFKDRASRCAVQLRRADIKNLRWIFAVNCGNGPKVVKMKGVREGNITKLSKMDLDLSCSCPGWRWLGPEYHGKTEDYLDGKPRGTASVPVVRDPTGINRVCKHVAAVLTHAKAWDVAKAKK